MKYLSWIRNARCINQDRQGTTLTFRYNRVVITDMFMKLLQKQGALKDLRKQGTRCY